MMLAAALATLAIAALAAAIFPLLKMGRATAARAQFDRAVYRDQLDELDRDVARGLLSAREATSARTEIQRRLLATEAAPQALPRRAGRSPLVAGVIAAIVVVGAAGTYLATGTPGLPDMPIASRNSESGMSADGPHGDFAKLAAALAKKLKSDPDNFAGWLLLARTEASFGHWQQSADAYRHALVLRPDDTDSATGYGEMLVLSADGTVTQAARDVFEHAIKLDPHGAVAQYYLALGDAQAGRTDAAIARWQKLAAEEPADSTLRAEVVRRIKEAARISGIPAPPIPPPAAPAPPPTPPALAASSPPADAVPAADAGAMAAIAQMPPAERDKMIRSMVAKLAQRLESHPNDPAGWLRLARSYTVLGEKDKAAAAYDHVAQLQPNDVSAPLQEVNLLMDGRSPDAPVPPQVVTLLHRVEAINPDQPDALWYLGLAAANAKRDGEARRYWQRLLPLLPTGSDQRKKVVLALQRLPTN